MKKLLLIFFYLVFASALKAQYNFDTLSHVQVGLGIYHLEIVEPSVPWTIDVLEIDLTVPYNFIETVKANDRLSGLEKTSSMAARKSNSGHVVVGAVNGDFYGGGGVPTNTQVLKGEVLKNPINREIIGFDYNDKPIIEVVSYSGSLIYSDTSIIISGVNAARGTDQLILYNSYKGSSTGTNNFGTEVSAEPIDDWFVNDTVRVIIENKILNQGNMAIQNDRVVLSAHGISTAFLNNLNAGDTLKIVNKLTPGLEKLKEVIGGSERIIHNGVNVGGWPEKHPRTAAGFSEDSTKLFLVTVDGRQSTSAGMTLTEMGNFMLQLGIYQAINLDGGGSTTMVVRDEIVNSPSDGGGERSVSNALMIVSLAPQGSLNQIQMSPNFKKIFRGETVQFTVNGWDEYFNPLPLEASQLQFSLSSDFGTITGSGLFTAGMDADTGCLYVNYNELKDTSQIIVKTIESINISPEDAVTDTVRIITFRTSAYDLDGVYRPLAANEYEWISSNESAGIIDSAGKFYGKREGITMITASYIGIIDTAFITVEINEGAELLDQIDDLNGWTFTGENLNMAAANIMVSTDTFSQGTGSFKINYEFTYDPSKLNWIYLKKDIPISGVPEFLWLDVKSDGQKHHISYQFSDDNGESFKMNTTKFAEETYFDSLKAPFENIAPIGQGLFFNYPVKLKQVDIKLGSSREAGNVYSGTIYIDNLTVSYPSPLTSIINEENIPSDFELFQNYPNPFNPSTVISWQLPISDHVTLKVFDILGNEIAILVNEEKSAGEYEVEFQSSVGSRQLASGIYFYQLKAGSFIQVKKMTLVK